MPDSSSQQFLRDLDKKLWSAADRLYANLDTAAKNFGTELANTASRGSAMAQREALPQVVRAAKDNFTSDQLPDLRADLVMANPSLNVSEWWDAKLEGDVRWKYGTPPNDNANFAWLEHMLHHLAPQGSMALLLASGSMSSNAGGEGDIRRSLVEADLVECMVALPGQLFTTPRFPPASGSS